jgi:hypothetical protein
MRFSVYESLYFLNRSIEDLIVILEEIKKAPGMPKRAFDAYRVDIEYLRSHATQDVLEIMNDREINEMATLGRQKKAYEDSLRDLDDVYFEVQEREEQRHKQGLPSLIGVLRGHQSSGSEREETDVEPSVARSSRVVESRRAIKSVSETLHRNQPISKTRPKRRSGRPSWATRSGQLHSVRDALGRAKPTYMYLVATTHTHQDR